MEQLSTLIIFTQGLQVIIVALLLHRSRLLIDVALISHRSRLYFKTMLTLKYRYF